ncbi:hypothetical protein [Agrobacterium vitis]|nr:hypothetical protein [Agrobacterium vitis]NSZ19514.1 hypothetical protein [Agrobacterium vitis]QZO06826.1 hypothetical protein K4831_22125 [Agrobacterium vitis]UJL91558.1 hypothetical protein AVF2S5_26645 [Agrobacterium vitis]
MTVRSVLLLLLLGLLSSCQSVPAERKTNCSCVWERLDHRSEGMLS